MTVEQGLEPAVGFAQRAQSIMDAQPGLDHQTVSSLALGSTSNDQATQNAQSVAQAISQTWDGYEQTFADPVLQQQPSLQSHVVQYIHDTIGAPPIDAGTITQLQKTLQQDGLGSGLATDGAWTPDWQQQYNSAVSTLKANQLAGDKPGSVKTSSALHGFLSAATVTGSLDHIAGWVKSIPGEARSFVGDVAAAGTELGHSIVHPSELLHSSQSEKALGQRVAADTENVLGAHTNQAAEAARFKNPAFLAEDLNTALTFTGAAGILRKAGTDIGATIARGVLDKGAPELARPPGIIAKTLFNGSQNGRLLGSKWVGNLPGVARVTPAIGKVAGTDGFRYTARTFMSQPYRQPLVRAAGTAFSRTQVLGAGLYGDALATSKLPGNTQAQDILNDRTFDAIDHNLTNYGPKVFGWSPLDVNNLQLFLHGPFSGAESASQSVGAHTQHFVNGITDALGVKGVPAAFQQATGLSRADWLKAADGDSNFLGQFMSNKVQGYAADWYAERQIGAPLDLANAAQKTQLASLRDQFYADPKLQAQTLSDMMHSDPNQAYLTRRIGADLTRNTSDPKAGLRQSLAEFKTGAVLMQKIIKAGDAKYLITPQGQDVLSMHALLGEGTPEGGVGSSSHLATAAPVQPGQLGLMGVNGLTRNQVLDRNGIADQFAAKIAASQDTEADQAVSQAMIDHLHQNHNWDARKLQLLGGNPQKLLDAVKSEANDLASDVHPTFDQTPQAAARMKALNDAGYKVVVGSHIGHLYDGTVPPLGDNNQWLTGLRKWAGKAGLDPSRVPDVEVGRGTQQGIVDELTHDIANDPRIQLNPYQTGNTVFSMLAKDEGVQKTLPWYSRSIFAATSHIGLNKTEIQAIQDAKPLDADGTRMTEQAARGELEQRMASGLGPRDASRKAIIQALTTTHDVKTQGGGKWTWEAIDEKSANLLFRSVVNGYRQPGYMMGWGAIENWGRAGYGIGDWAAKRLPGSSLLQNVANWPNRVAQVRNQLRFTVSPIFDLRRWTKQSLKMGLEGVEPVANPLQSLIDSGDVDSSTKLLAQIGHSPVNEDQINADRMLASRSVFGLYSPQWHGAYFVNEKMKQLQAAAAKEQTTPGDVAIFRHHLPTENLDDATTYPGGAYYQIDGPNAVQGAFKYPGRLTARRTGSTENALVLNHPENTDDEALNAGSAAIQHFLGSDERQRIVAKAKFNPPELAREINDRFDLNVNPEADHMYLPDVYGAALARQAGYKAIVYHDNALQHEFVDLGGASRTAVPKTTQAMHAEVQAAYNRVFKYGADGGQSSLERTMNTIFFPFSFEKTLLRNTGGYLLDHPAQALALDLAVDQWRKMDKNAAFGKFMLNHAPLVTELNTLNAFSHGISPGQLGGINAPTIGAIGGDAMHAYHSNPDLRVAALNLFLPQNWGANLSPSNLQKYLPVWGQLQKVLSAADQQTKIGYAALYDTAQQAAGSAKRLPTLTTIGQQQYGTREKVKLIDQMAPVLSFNGKVADDASKIPWQAGPNVPANLVGSPINRTTIGQYVQSLYPEYDPTSGSLYAQQQQVALGKFIANVKQTDPAKGAAMQEFAKTANSVIGKINRDEYTPADQATVQGLMHDIGRSGAKVDPAWNRLYSGFFAYALGPIISPDGKATS